MTTAVEPATQHRVRRCELGAFLRSRRARITPEQVGLPLSGRRRTPGLRREEVAQLAGVGVTWYTWLEQGRDINASEQVLDAISRTLRLDPHEHVHLFTLAGAPEPPTEAKECSVVTESMRAMLTQLEPFPAAVRNGRYDLLGYNRGYTWLMGEVDAIPFEDRNTLVQCLLNPRWRERTLGWEENVPRMVAAFRAAMAEHVAEPAWKSLVKRLKAESPLFADLWSRHDVNAEPIPVKRYRHPEAGLLTFRFTYLYTGRRSEVLVSTYTPADEETAAKLPKTFD
ncbi:helix-turn-helix transcriptional regulator [Amycolatopsis jiangsuensis]|uniref:Transcriptional regulator with XRE-family HTH domain n=1 Tax=Amycolatopsis jiangsuensis TaxID=1181879 RepID=A0A840J0V7_9PSEU|nr:helix-turn-helix transcriptional regulator [Amycolatopsis jiangsuensis]MBB4687117.1 transcriptional regulator with XRE-family HTH domain [Amycolatopsis jiangsuensis]